VDGRGVPLSLVVTGANVHDCKGLDGVLSAVMVKRKNPQCRRHKHLCADAGYRGAEHLRTMKRHGYIPHVVGRSKEAEAKRLNPKKKARRWVVEVSHSWFNRFRKPKSGSYPVAGSASMGLDGPNVGAILSLT
jgi:IS5 family transposase